MYANYVFLYANGMQIPYLYVYNLEPMEQQSFISLYLDTRRAKANKKFPVKLRVFTSAPRKQMLYPTTFEFNQTDFQSIWETVKPRKEHQDIRKELQAVLLKAEKVAEKINPFTFVDFEKKLFASSGSSENLIWHYQLVIAELNQRKQFSTANTYSLALKSIKNFIESYSGKEPQRISFFDITPKWLEQYESRMIDELKRSRTTIGIYLRTLRTVFNNAISQKDISIDLYPFGKKKYVIPSVKSVKKSLSSAELKSLLNAKKLPIEQEKARDFWFFSYSCNGMNIKDIAHLKFENIKDNKIFFYRAKTIKTRKENLKPVTVYLTDFANGIIKKYGTERTKPNQYIFSILNESDTELKKHTNVKNFTRFINQHIKKLAKAKGITSEISTYWARHSFATTAIRNGASIEFVSEAFDHSDIKVTKGYFAGFSDETKREFAENLMKFTNKINKNDK